MMKAIFSIVFCFCSLLLSALNPSRTYKHLPEKYNMQYEAHLVKTADNVILNAWHFPSKTNSERLVLISHNGEGNMADYLRRVDQFTSIGYNVVIYDYRGFGESSEFEIDSNMYIYPQFQADLTAMIDYCRKNYAETFDLYGWGIGAGLSLGIGYHRPEIRYIIADSPFLSIKDLEKRFSKWDVPMEVPLAGYEKQYEPLYSLDEAPAKNLKGILLMVGSDDLLFDEEDMKKLYAKQKKLVYKPIYVIENPDQKDNFRVDKVAYFKMISSFLGV